MKFIAVFGLFCVVLTVKLTEALECTEAIESAFTAVRDECFSELMPKLSIGSLKEKMQLMIKCTADKLETNSDFDDIRTICASDNESEKLNCFADEFRKVCPNLLP